MFLSLRLDKVLTFDRLLDSRAALQAVVERHFAAALATYALIYVLLVAIAVPGGSLLTLAGGALFGAAAGGPVAVLASTAGAALLFLAARSVLADLVSQRAQGAFGRLRQGFRQSAWSYMLFLRLTPFCPFWLVNLAAAASGIGLRTFVWTTALGILPATLVFAAAGQNLDALAAVSDAARASCRATGVGECRATVPWSAIVTPGILATLTGLSILALVPAALRRRGAHREWRA